jgi:hypothetical protein
MEIPTFPLNDFVLASRIRFLQLLERYKEEIILSMQVAFLPFTAGAVVVQME